MRDATIAALVLLVVAGAGFVVSRRLPPPAPAPAALAVASDLREPSARELREGPSASRSEAAEPNATAAAAVEPAANESAPEAFYQWTDENGAVRFARSLADVPPAWRERAGRVAVAKEALIRPEKRASRPMRASALAAGDPAPRRAMHDVTVYTAPWCGWCRKTLAYLDARGVDYVNKDIEADPDNRDELIERSGDSGIPVVDIDGALIRGYNPSEMAALLD